MTLEQWAKGWPYHVIPWAGGAAYVPDCASREDHRRKAWSLTDYLVSSVMAGTIWFVPRTAEDRANREQQEG